MGKKPEKPSAHPGDNCKPGDPVEKCPLAELVVNVKDADGAPVQDAKVSAGALGAKQTTAAGVADFGKVAPGAYDISAEKADHAPAKAAPKGKDEKKAVDVPGSARTVVDLVQHPIPTVRFVKIESTEKDVLGVGTVTKSDDDFAPRIGEVAKIHVEAVNIPAAFSGKVKLAIGRLTNTANNPATADVNESFALLAELEKPVTPGPEPIKMVFDWNGKATVAAPRQFSDRKTPDVTAGVDVAIPMEKVDVGGFAPHGLYVIDEVTLLDGATTVAKHRPASAGMSIPGMANLIFNANWPANLAAFGLTPFQSLIEEALRRFGGRDYKRSAGPASRINVRFVTDPALSNSDSMRMSIGGTDPSDFGSTPDGPAPLSDNIFAIHEGLGVDVSIFPGTYLLFNNFPGRPADQALFRAAFSPLGVRPAQTSAANGTATARAVTGAGAVTGAATAVDNDNTLILLNDDGIATVTSKDPALVPAARAADIERALRAIVRMMGNTINHEMAHCYGVVSRVRANNKVTIGGVDATSPLDGDGGAHNKTTASTNIVDAGGTRTFERRIEDSGVANTFSASNAKYLRDCLPFDPTDD